MNTHPRSIVKPSLPAHHTEVPEEQQKLDVENGDRGSDESMTAHRCEEKEREGRKADWCSNILYILVLVGLAGFILTEVVLERRVSSKNTDKFLKNLEHLKLDVIAKNKQTAPRFGLNFKSLKDDLGKSDQQTHKKEDATLPLSKPQQRQKANEYSKYNGSEKAISELGGSLALDKDLGVSGNKRAEITNTISPSSVRPSKGGPASRQRVVGTGIPETLLIKARLRRTLVSLPFNETNDISQEELAYYQQRYHISTYSELPFCIVIPTYNNAENDRYLKNIRSVVMQNYSNYHVIVIDDASTDGTGTLILSFLRQQQVLPKERYEIIRNEQQMRAMHNLRFAAVNFCKPDDIFVIVDGDDELLGRQVLKLFNAKFQEEGLYFMYTNFLSLKGRTGYSRPFPQRIIKDSAYRRYPFVTSHLRAFYTQLFLNVREEDLRDEKGEFLRAANDVAICIPILEQAHERIAYVPELTYLYNSNTGLNNHALRLKEQRANDKKVRTHAKYARVGDLFQPK